MLAARYVRRLRLEARREKGRAKRGRRRIEFNALLAACRGHIETEGQQRQRQRHQLARTLPLSFPLLHLPFPLPIITIVAVAAVFAISQPQRLLLPSNVRDPPIAARQSHPSAARSLSFSTTPHAAFPIKPPDSPAHCGQIFRSTTTPLTHHSTNVMSAYLGESPPKPSMPTSEEIGRILESVVGETGRAGATKVAAKLANLVSPSPTPSNIASKAFASAAAVLFPSLPPWLATACWLSRLVAFLILAPIVLIGLVDFAEYAVVRTLGEHARARGRRRESIQADGPAPIGLRRRKLRVKTSNSDPSQKPSSRYHGNLRLSPAQMRKSQATGYFNPAPLLTPGAYDADALLRHRARSTSSASFEALEEWQRTGGSFARVSEVRMAASSASGASSPDEGGPRRSPSPKARASIGVDGPLGLAESDAEDSGAESGPGSPDVSWRQRQGLKHSMLNFTPVEPGKKLGLDFGEDVGTPKPSHQQWIDIAASRQASAPSGAVAAAMAADLEPDFSSSDVTEDKTSQD